MVYTALLERVCGYVMQSGQIPDALALNLQRSAPPLAYLQACFLMCCMMCCLVPRCAAQRCVAVSRMLHHANGSVLAAASAMPCNAGYWSNSQPF